MISNLASQPLSCVGIAYGYFLRWEVSKNAPPMFPRLRCFLLNKGHARKENIMHTEMGNSAWEINKGNVWEDPEEGAQGDNCATGRGWGERHRTQSSSQQLGPMTGRELSSSPKLLSVNNLLNLRKLSEGQLHPNNGANQEQRKRDKQEMRCVT